MCVCFFFLGLIELLAAPCPFRITSWLERRRTGGVQRPTANGGRNDAMQCSSAGVWYYYLSGGFGCSERALSSGAAFCLLIGSGRDFRIYARRIRIRIRVTEGVCCNNLLTGWVHLLSHERTLTSQDSGDQETVPQTHSGTVCQEQRLGKEIPNCVSFAPRILGGGGDLRPQNNIPQKAWECLHEVSLEVGRTLAPDNGDKDLQRFPLYTAAQEVQSWPVDVLQVSPGPNNSI